ncbi:hypothetical protein EDD75_1338 [Thermodesulfitimonas autotrophica]|uniref:Uncharacterized protein n=1 Tax=Thermodesulfitimonas autotrophica TaxID=1894989 RepID=A0A3N5APB6_9THEO|nr:hypothetical protein EDD75_1338 [Thermodesulfitimonas autotrophica]
MDLLQRAGVGGSPAVGRCPGPPGAGRRKGDGTEYASPVPAVTGEEGALPNGASIKVVPRVEDPVLKRDGVSVL